MGKTVDIKKWCQQLLREHEYICFQYRLKLRPAVIEITDNKSHWGRWSPYERKIEISKTLILNYPWDVVLQIFKHEMAHQICSELYRTDDGHRASFQKACKSIGICPPFNSASIDLDQPIPLWKEQWQRRQNEFDNRNSPLRKIKKLLSLAQSTNEHEAYRAAAKAQQLILKYNVDKLSDSEPSDDCVYLIINHKKKRIEFHQSQIVGLLSEYYFVQAIFSDLYDPQTNQIHKTIELMGRQENVLIAEYVYYFLNQQLTQLWVKNKDNFSNRRSYYMGVIKGFRKNLEQTLSRAPDLSSQDHSLNSPSSKIKSLIKQDEKNIRDFMSSRYPRMHNRTSNHPSQFDNQSYTQGQKDGEKIKLNKGIQQEGSSHIHLLSKR